MAENGALKLTLMEAKILRLGKKQHDKGYAGGAITPGLVRKETEYSYRAINTALETLIAQELMEKSVRSTFRDGALVELDVYKITYKGMEAVEKLEAGDIQVTGAEPAPQPRRSEVGFQKSWDRPREERPRQPEYGRFDRPREQPNREMGEAVNALHAAMKALSADVRDLHAKVDRLTAHHAAQATKPVAPAPPPLPAAKGGRRDDHAMLVLGAAKALTPVRDFVIAEEVRDTYFRECARLGLKPKGQSQFTAYLKRLEAKGLLQLKRMGCRNLGIKGHGSRVVVTLSKEGSEFLAQHGEN